MAFRSCRMGLVWVLALCAIPAWAQDATQTPPAEEPADTIEEVIVVSASRTEQPVAEAPATVSVITSQDIAQTPADDYGDLLRNVPGLNVSQISARDIQITGRGATNSLATSQLVLLDETLNGLDPHAARAARLAVESAAKAGAAVLMSTHLLGVAERLCTRLLFIDKGKLVKDVRGRELDELLARGVGAVEELYLSLVTPEKA